jgi:hypothetical protein
VIKQSNDMGKTSSTHLRDKKHAQHFVEKFEGTNEDGG